MPYLSKVVVYELHAEGGGDAHGGNGEALARFKGLERRGAGGDGERPHCG